MVELFNTYEDIYCMITKTFFECTNCGNKETFKTFTSSFRVVKQSPEFGIRVESGILPNRGIPLTQVGGCIIHHLVYRREIEYNIL
jgi:hypothetical protein